MEITKGFLLNCKSIHREIIIDELCLYTGKKEEAILKEFGLKKFKVVRKYGYYYVFHNDKYGAKNEAKNEPYEDGNTVVSVEEV